jgi:hypothetical protein
MAKKPKFLSSLAPEHKESLTAERDKYIDQEKSESYDVRAQRHFDILEAGGDPHDEYHRHAFFLHQTSGLVEKG